MIKINMNYFIKTIKKHKIIGRRKCINLNICSVDVLSEKLETKVKSSIRKEIMRGGFFLKKGAYWQLLYPCFIELYVEHSAIIVIQSCLLITQTNLDWDVMTIYSLAIRRTFRVLDEPSALWDEIAAIFVWEKF